MDYPWLRIAHDKRIPPKRGHDKPVPPRRVGWARLSHLPRKKDESYQSQDVNTATAAEVGTNMGDKSTMAGEVAVLKQTD